MSVFLILLGAVLWGLSGGLGGLLMEQGWPPLLVSWHRAVFGLAAVVLWLVFHPAERAGWPPVRVMRWSVVAGLGVTGNFAFYFLSIQAAGVAVAATLMYSAPAFVLLVGVLTGRERLTAIKAFAVACVLGGMVLLTRAWRLDPAAMPLWGIAAGLLAGLCYTVFIFGFKAAASSDRTAQVIAIALATVSLLLLPFLSFDGLTASLSSPDMLGFVPLGVFGAGVAFVAYLSGLRRTAPTVAALVAVVEPVTAALFGVVVLGQGLALLQISGMAIILLAVALAGQR